MSRPHKFKDNTANESPHTIIYCEWCGAVAYDDGVHGLRIKKQQEVGRSPCPNNPDIVPLNTKGESSAEVKNTTHSRDEEPPQLGGR